MSGWIGVDLDGTLAEYHGWPKDGSIGKPIPAMLARVKEWIASGREVRIFTARVWPWGTSAQNVDGNRVSDASWQIDRITEWCVKHIGQVLPITCVKDCGMVELWDDRAVQVVSNTGLNVMEHEESTSEEERRANAHLIAAAPEYYDLVEFLYGLLTKELACPDVLTTAELVDACTRIEVLQAKARGEVTPETPAPDGAETGSEATQLRSERDELKYRLQTWDDTHAEEILVLRSTLKDAVDEVAELRKDKKRLDRLERDYSRIRVIEPPDAFPTPQWIIFDDVDEAIFYPGSTLRKAIDKYDAAMSAEEKSHE